MKSGAIELLTKPLNEQELLDAIQAGIERDRARREEARLAADLQARFESLTPRERQIMARGAEQADRAPSAPFRERGFDVQFQIPIFDGGEVRVRQTAETYNQVFNRLTERAVNVRSEARDAFPRLSLDLRHRHALSARGPAAAQKIIGWVFSSMQIDVFALLTEAKQRIASLRAAIEAKRNFGWRNQI